MHACMQVRHTPVLIQWLTPLYKEAAICFTDVSTFTSKTGEFVPVLDVKVDTSAKQIAASIPESKNTHYRQ
jgi:hypothetical protein